jgi:hypothetical protein
VIGLAIVAATALSYAAAWVLDIPILVPILNTAASFPFMLLALKRGDVRLAVARMLLWAWTLAVCATLLSYARPAESESLFLRSEAYRTEMFRWVLTGRGPESTPAQFIPQQAGQALLFSGLALMTGGAAAMPAGALLMNYMGHYVGALAAASRRPALTMLLAWHPWAVIRVISFVTLGVVLSVPVLARLGRFDIDSLAARRLLVLASAGLIVDIALKWLAAPAWQRMLLRAVGW